MGGEEHAAPVELDPRGVMPWPIFAIQLAWLLGLVALFVVWVNSASLRGSFPHFYGSNPGIPVEVPWFGAIGGCLASFTGIFAYNRQWKRSMDYWHVLRPLLGAVSGGVSCLLLVVTLRAASSSASLKTDPITFDAVAFLFGYAERSFRQLIKNVTDVLIKPGASDSTTPTSRAAAPSRRGGTSEHPHRPPPDAPPPPPDAPPPPPGADASP